MLAALALALVMGEAAQDAPPAASAPIHIDAVVSDSGGRFVDNLRAEDFEVLEGDVPREVASVRLVKTDPAVQRGVAGAPIDSAAAERTEAAREGTRLFAFFLDEYHVTAGDVAARVRDALDEFMQRVVGPQDLLLVVKPLDSLVTLRMTRDRDAVARAISTFQGRKGEYEPRTALEKTMFAADPTRIDAVRGQVALSALNAVVNHLSTLSVARKTLVMVSEGFPGVARRRGDPFLPTVETVVRSAVRGNVAIYPIDARALSDAPPTDTMPAAADAEAGRNLLAQLARETRGSAVFTRDGVAAGLERIQRESSGYYLLALTPLPGHSDGRFHPLQVLVKRQPALHVVARQGYWAAPDGDATRTARAATPSGRLPDQPRRISPLIRPWFGLSRGDAGRTSVQFVWEPAGQVPGDRARSSRPARIALKATGDDGTLVFEGMVRATGADPDAGQTTPAHIAFDTPPGRVRVQMSIEDAQARVLDTDVRDVVVKPLGDAVALGTVAVLRSRTAREFRAARENPDAAPAAGRDFSRAERLLFKVHAYAADGAPELSATLSSTLGGRVRPLMISPASAPNLYHVDLQLASLAPGEYVAEIVAAAAGSQAKELVTFRVTP
jgi:VWFA-related protein